MQRHILVIDDEQSVRDAFALALESEGYEVDTAADGEEGLRKFSVNPPDLVFLDLRMPGMGGIETLRRLKGLSPNSPVYIVTAFYQAYLEPLQALQEEGVTFQLAKKPLGAHDIREITRSVFEGPEAVFHE
ncbi:MAG: response regulator [Thiohalomonadaceae bacterium]